MDNVLQKIIKKKKEKIQKYKKEYSISKIEENIKSIKNLFKFKTRMNANRIWKLKVLSNYFSKNLQSSLICFEIIEISFDFKIALAAFREIFSCKSCEFSNFFNIFNMT